MCILFYLILGDIGFYGFNHIFIFLSYINIGSDTSNYLHNCFYPLHYSHHRCLRPHYHCAIIIIIHTITINFIYIIPLIIIHIIITTRIISNNDVMIIIIINTVIIITTVFSFLSFCRYHHYPHKHYHYKHYHSHHRHRGRAACNTLLRQFHFPPSATTSGLGPALHTLINLLLSLINISKNILGWQSCSTNIIKV